jgi:uncharacterized glyoxalase superfamily protein PhnB
MVTNRSAPSSTVVPILVYKDVGHAIDWLCRAFGFAERLRFARALGRRTKTIIVLTHSGHFVE